MKFLDTFKVMALSTLLLSCTFRSFDSDTKSDSDDTARSGMASLWKVLSKPAYPVQLGCDPMEFKVPSGTRTKGTILMFHGLSACPQQYSQWGSQFAALGYQVYVPLLPGHGKIPISTDPRQDDISELPLETAQFQNFSAGLSDFLAKEPGERIVVGSSLGGTYSLDVAARLSEIAPVQKVLAIVPMLGITNLLNIGIVLYKTCAHLPFICGKYSDNRNVLKFGEACEKVEIPKGRAGYCQFMTQHVDAMVAYSSLIQQTLFLKTKNFGATKFLFFMGEKDLVVSRGPVISLDKEFRDSGVSSRVWTLQKPSAHSLFSPYDEPFNKPWLKGLTASANAFIAKGAYTDPGN